MPNHVQDTLTFFRAGKPEPTDADFHTQIGCHFEEVAEMLEEIQPLDAHATLLVNRAKTAIHDLAEFLKGRQGVIIIPIESRRDMIDAICDQLVTAIGTAHCLGMDVDGAFDEVNRSNLSKFGDDGKPMLDDNGKIMKGPNYFKAQLAAFV